MPVKPVLLIREEYSNRRLWIDDSPTADRFTLNIFDDHDTGVSFFLTEEDINTLRELLNSWHKADKQIQAEPGTPDDLPF